MHLSDRRRGQRSVLEMFEHLVHRTSQLSLEHDGDVFARSRRSVILEHGQLCADGLWQELGSGREDLAELDEEAAGLLESLPEVATELRLARHITRDRLARERR
jgi:hypothetical protein